MKPMRIMIALLCLLVPVAARGLWFYQGIYQRPAPVVTPDFAGLTAPQAPLSTPISEPTPTAAEKVVLIDQNHSNLLLMAEIETLTHDLGSLGARLEMLDPSSSLAYSLKYANALVIIAPSTPFSQYEIQSIREFIQRGGRLLVVCDPTRLYSGSGNSSLPPLSSVDYANNVLESFGIAFNEDYVYDQTNNESNFRNVIFTRFADSPITAGLGQLILYGALSLKTSQTGLVMGGDTTLTSLTDQGGGLVVAASAQPDQVLAVGDLSFMSPTFSQVADNRLFIRNVSQFLTEGDPQHSLATFPFLFSRPIVIQTVQEEPLDKVMIDSLTNLQQTLQGLHQTAALGARPEKEKDLIVLGLLPPSEKLRAYLKEFKIDWNPAETGTPASPTVGTPAPEASPTATETPAYFGESGKTASEGASQVIELPGFGKVSTNELGLLLYSSTSERNTLILLAGSPDQLVELTSLVRSGSLETCLTQGQIAVCKLSASGGGAAG